MTDRPADSERSEPGDDVVHDMRSIAAVEARRLSPSRADADDLAQQTVFQLLRSWNRLKLGEKADTPWWPAYVRRSVRHRQIQDKRSETRRRNRERRAETHPVPGPASRPGTLRPAPDHPTDLDLLIQRLAVIEAAAQLPSAQQADVLDVMVDGCSVEEIAHKTGRSVATVQASLRRATVRLKEILDPRLD